MPPAAAGHTHGGQIVLPFIGYTPFAPVYDRTYVSGLKPWGVRFVNVTRGIYSTLGVRFNCPPEISILDLML